jgi:hypothetical protein
LQAISALNKQSAAPESVLLAPSLALPLSASFPTTRGSPGSTGGSALALPLSASFPTTRGGRGSTGGSALALPLSIAAGCVALAVGIAAVIVARRPAKESLSYSGECLSEITPDFAWTLTATDVLPTVIITDALPQLGFLE